jgi:hypothetical protein
MLGLYHTVVLDGSDSDNEGSNLAQGMDVSILTVCVNLRLLLERNHVKLQRGLLHKVKPNLTKSKNVNVVCDCWKKRDSVLLRAGT